MSWTKYRLLALGITVVLFLSALSFRSWGYYLAFHESRPGVDFVALTLTVTFTGMLGYWLLNSGSHGSLNEPTGGVIAWLHPKFLLPAFSILVMAVITQRVIPEYAQLASIITPCELLRARAEQESIPWVAHRNSWDAFSFQLQGEELPVYSSREWSDFLHWLQSHPRSMVWMRDYEKRVEAFVRALPRNIRVDEVIDLGRVQGIILRQSPIQQASYEE